MALPSSGITWTDYRNTTPTFNLTPIEKPDCSPFLIHMTGKGSLVKILKGENLPQGLNIEDREGFLKAIKPSFDGQQAYYNSEVVCFSESPIFALDFFRYRSFRRWNDNQQFGIGFSKTELILHRGVRPVIYFDTNTNSDVLNLANQIIDGKYQVIDSNGEVKDYTEIFEKIKPLLFPLLEDTPFQGFMWEREWRCTSNNGMIFPHEMIKVICCPSNERSEIEEILGDLTKQIEIVESWREYDDMTNYLKRRQSEVDGGALSKIKEVKNLGELNLLKTQNEQTLNAISAYYGVFKETVNGLEGRNIQQTIEDMKKKSKEIDEQIKVIIEAIKIKAKEEQAKKKQ